MTRFDGMAFPAADIRETQHAAMPRHRAAYAGKMADSEDGCIYWLAVSENGPLKIGFSHRQIVNRRMEQVLRDNNSASGFVIAVWDARSEDEARLHYHLRRQCLGRERYPLTEELIHLSKRPSHEVCQMLREQYPNVWHVSQIIAEINQNARLNDVDFEAADNMPSGKLRGAVITAIKDAALMKGVKKFDESDYGYLLAQGFSDAEAHTLHILLDAGRFVPTEELRIRTCMPGTAWKCINVRICHIRKKIRDRDLPYIVNSYYGRGYTAERTRLSPPDTSFAAFLIEPEPEA